MMLENLCAMPAGAEASSISSKIKPRSWSRVWASSKEHSLVPYIWLRVVGAHSCAVDMLGVEKEEVHRFLTHGLIGVIRIGGGGGDDATRTTVTATKTSLKSELIALLQTLSRLFHLVWFVKCWQILSKLNTKGLYQSPGKDKESCYLVFASSTK